MWTHLHRAIHQLVVVFRHKRLAGSGILRRRGQGPQTGGDVPIRLGGDHRQSVGFPLATGHVEEERCPVEIGVGQIQMVRAHRQLIGIDPIAHLHSRRTRRIDLPGILIHLPPGQRDPLLSCRLKLLHMTGILPHQVGSRRPHRQSQPQRHLWIHLLDLQFHLQQVIGRIRHPHCEMLAAQLRRCSNNNLWDPHR
jgi:hypothetical protein